jgi:small-conductance mechanosensitive channel/CRP-like cAMP-binding protein
MMSSPHGIIDYFWRDDSQYVLLMVAALAAILLKARSVDDKTLGRTLVFFLIALVGQFASGLVFALGFTKAASVLREVFILCEGFAIIRLWGMLIFRVGLPLVRLRPPQIVADLLVMVGYVAFGLVRLRYAGMELGSIVTTSAVMTAVIAFAMQDTLGNLLGGIALQLDNSIQTGDWIRVDDLVGRVTAIRWRSTSIETRGWETVVIPNSVLMKSKFAVLGRRAGEPLRLRRAVMFNVGFATPPAKVIAAVEQAMLDSQVPGIAADPAPHCVLSDFQNGFVRYSLRYWLTDLLNDEQTDSAVRSHVLTALQRAGMRLAVPEHSAHSVQDDDEHRKEVMERELARRLAAVKKAALFSTFREDELRMVAERLVYAPFATGAIITRQGAEADWLYIMASGEAEAMLQGPGDQRRVLGALRAGSFFGEMGLMTGASRAATVTARSDVECYRLDKSAFEDVLRARPALADEIADIMVARRLLLTTAQQDIEEWQLEHPAAEESSELLARIKRFFGLGTGPQPS